MYKVIKFFTDLQDEDHAYHEGDFFPREGLKVTPERIAELSSASNRRGVPLIIEVMPEPLPFTEPEEEAEAPKPKKKATKKKG